VGRLLRILRVLLKVIQGQVYIILKRIINLMIMLQPGCLDLRGSSPWFTDRIGIIAM
jgi:hypothetical protein